MTNCTYTNKIQAMQDANSLNIDEQVSFLGTTSIFVDILRENLQELAKKSIQKRFQKGALLYCSNEPFNYFCLITQGLVRVRIYSQSGKRVTYLLVKRGECPNLLGVFTPHARSLEAQAVEETTVLCWHKRDFVAAAEKYPKLFINILAILDQSIESANSRILDMVDRKVEFRVKRVLFSLYGKFGGTLQFTGTEIADLACTTTETTLRVLSQFRDLRLIETSRGRITILDPGALQDEEHEDLWL